MAATTSPRPELPAGRILRFDGVTGAYLDTFVPPGSGGLRQPVKLLFRTDGRLYVASQSTGSVLRYDATTGAFLDAFVPQGSGGLSSPRGLTFGPDGSLYVADNDPAAIRRYDGKTGAFLDNYLTEANGLSSATYLIFLERPLPARQPPRNRPRALIPALRR